MKEHVCKGLKFEDCELAILRMQVDEAEKKVGKRLVNSDEVQKILRIVETFIRRRGLVCYGGLAIDRLLPDDAKIYNKDVDLPDYDFFSPDAVTDAKALGDTYAKAGYQEIEVKSGQHHGTFKVFVNFFPIADITFLPRELFNTIKRSAKKINGMLFTDPNFLRMGMYLELSRPDGDVSRFEKVLKRLILINKYYPLTDVHHCDTLNFQREMVNREQETTIYDTILDAFIDQGVVFFGGYALTLYSRYMPYHLRKKLEKFPDFDVLSNTPDETAEYVKERLEDEHVRGVKIIHHDPVGEIVPEHYEIRVGRDSVAFVYRPIACHSYNVLHLHGKKLKIATIDTMLSFYLAFLYANLPNYKTERILCMSHFLFDVQQKNRLKQRGLLKRFSVTCYGHQKSVEELRAEKAEKFVELRGQHDRKHRAEYEDWFLNYHPAASKVRPERPDHTKKAPHKRRRRRRRTHKRGIFWGGGG